MQATLYPSSSSVQPDDTIYYKIDGVRNPQTGDVTSNFEILVKDLEGYLVAESRDTTASVQVSTAANITDFSLKATDMQQGA